MKARMEKSAKKKQIPTDNKIIIRIEKTVKREESKTPIEKKVLWYDTFYKRMREFKCTRLNFIYKKEEFVQFPNGTKKPKNETTEEDQEEYGVSFTNMLRPEPETQYKKNTEQKKNFDFVKEWIKRHEGEIEAELANDVIVKIPKKLLTEFTDDLYREKIRYDLEK